MRQPTSKEIEEAKDYLRQRLNAELSMENNLLAIMYQAAKEIVAVSYKYNIPQVYLASLITKSCSKKWKLL